MPRTNRHKGESQRLRGDHFVNEPTGSAPAVNLDGQTDHPYTDQILDELRKEKKEK
ncbi:hypothetical protein [Desulfurispora thermophila]|uniref:hypothetical protein n=1 Tax=Desulfurispora thermophila TaxID=265470 RepID=UPI00037B3E95|nr:hypothetical protein [Desulfurispora thermophila]